MSVTVGTVNVQGKTILGGGAGDLKITKLHCASTCTLEFMSPLGKMFTIGDLTTESTKGVYFNGKLSAKQDIDILK